MRGLSWFSVGYRGTSDRPVFQQGGTRPLPPLGRRSALHPVRRSAPDTWGGRAADAGSFSLDAQRKGTKRNPFGPGPLRPAVNACHWQARPPAASADFFSGGRTNSRISDSVAPSVASSTSDRPSTSYGTDQTGPPSGQGECRHSPVLPWRPIRRHSTPLPAKNSSHNAFMGKKNQPKATKNTHRKPGSPGLLFHRSLGALLHLH